MYVNISSIKTDEAAEESVLDQIEARTNQYGDFTLKLLILSNIWAGCLKSLF